MAVDKIVFHGVPFGEYLVDIEGGTLEEVLEQAAKLEELNEDAIWLKNQGIEEVAISFRNAGNKGKHYGFKDRYSNVSLDFGNSEKGLYPGWRFAFDNPHSESRRGKLYDPDNVLTGGDGAAPQQQQQQPPVDLPPPQEPYQNGPYYPQD